MLLVRPSTPEDIPAQRLLWHLAFGDEGAYVDNFYSTYYRPERVLVLEEGGQVRSMTAWFDTTFVVPGRGAYRAAYLYAVATHPDCRGRGLAGRLLAEADRYFRALSIPAVTTVPAEPSLHDFFGANGFRECFVHGQFSHPLDAPPLGAAPALVPLAPADYCRLREEALTGTPHIALDVQAVTYQDGACRLSGGGLYALEHPQGGTTLLCAEGMGDGTLLVKELLGPLALRESALSWLPRLLPAWSGCFRVPQGDTPFGMLKWLDPQLEAGWDWTSVAYLGLAFD